MPAVEAAVGVLYSVCYLKDSKSSSTKNIKENKSGVMSARKSFLDFLWPKVLYGMPTGPMPGR